MGARRSSGTISMASSASSAGPGGARASTTGAGTAAGADAAGAAVSGGASPSIGTSSSDRSLSMPPAKQSRYQRRTRGEKPYYAEGAAPAASTAASGVTRG